MAQPLAFYPRHACETKDVVHKLPPEQTVLTSMRTLSSSTAPKSAGMSLNPTIEIFWKSYNTDTSPRLKLIDAFLVFTMLTGIAQFVYCVLVTNFPFNAFLAGFASCVGQFVLLASLRSQVNPVNKQHFSAVSPERAFADFAFGSIILHFFVFNFLG